MAQPHHRDYRYVKLGARVINAANANPRAVCWRCGRTLLEHPHHTTGRQPTWTRGHTIRGSRTWTPWLDVTHRPPVGDWLAPEASTCNIIAGNDARILNADTGYTWP